MVNKLYVVTPRGFCAGVEMAIKALTWMLKIYDEPVYCYHEIVHNDWIVEKFKKKNVIFIENTDELPKDSIVMLSAHGTAPKIEENFKNISMTSVNSVCPLVTKVHHEAKKFSENGKQIIYVGHKNHDEAIGALGVAPENMHLVESVDDIKSINLENNDVALLAQTTLAMSEWEPILNKAKEEFNNLDLPRKSDLCYATTNRQKALINISKNVDVVLVVGSSTSSNTKALVTTIKNLGKEAHRIETLKDLELLNLEYKNVAITAGASAPEHIVNEISNFLNPEYLEYYIDTEEEEYFPLPKELRSNISSLTGLLTTMFPMNDVEPVNSISKDKSWSATEALSSL
jgi:4-hydroxy-3-methylbut-2-enyl diphosphate reductase